MRGRSNDRKWKQKSESREKREIKDVREGKREKGEKWEKKGVEVQRAGRGK